MSAATNVHPAPVQGMAYTRHGMSGATSLYPAPAAAYLGWIADDQDMSSATCLEPLVFILPLLLLSSVG